MAKSVGQAKEAIMASEYGKDIRKIEDFADLGCQGSIRVIRDTWTGKVYAVHVNGRVELTQTTIGGKMNAPAAIRDS